MPAELMMRVKSDKSGALPALTAREEEAANEVKQQAARKQALILWRPPIPTAYEVAAILWSRLGVVHGLTHSYGPDFASLG